MECKAKFMTTFSTKLNIEQSLRFEDNLSQFKQTFTESCKVVFVPFTSIVLLSFSYLILRLEEPVLILN